MKNSLALSSVYEFEIFRNNQDLDFLILTILLLLRPQGQRLF